MAVNHNTKHTVPLISAPAKLFGCHIAHLRPQLGFAVPLHQAVADAMAPGLHESETVFASIAPFLYANEQATAAVNNRTWQEQHSNTASIKGDYERWRDWVTDKRYE